MFPNDKEYLNFISTLDVNRLRLTTGNCGIFAFALKEVFGEGRLFKIGDYAHILLEHNGKFYDGVTIYDDEYKLFDSYWGNFADDSDDDPYMLNEIDSDEAYNLIWENTCHTLELEDFIHRFETSGFAKLAFQHTL